MNVFLIHGPDSVQIQAERLRVLNEMIPADQRDENLTEFEPSANRPLRLAELLPTLLSEMGTVSFFPGARRVAVVNDLSDFWAGEKDSSKKPAAPAKTKRKKSPPTSATGPAKVSITAEERLIRYFERELEATGNAVIFTVFEDPEKQRRAVDKRLKLVQWIKDNGRLISFEGPKPIAWRMGDAIRGRNLPFALGLFREAYRKGKTDQALAIFHAILREVHFLLQAKIASAAGRQLSQSFIAAELLPPDDRSNLLKIHSYPRENYTRAASFFTVAELTNALKELYEINRCILPAKRTSTWPMLDT